MKRTDKREGIHIQPATLFFSFYKKIIVTFIVSLLLSFLQITKLIAENHDIKKNVILQFAIRFFKVKTSFISCGCENLSNLILQKLFVNPHSNLDCSSAIKYQRASFQFSLFVLECLKSDFHLV